MTERDRPTVAPRVNLDPHPPNYKTPVPRLPRDPLLPSDIGDLMRPDIEDRDIHDTEPLTGQSGEPHEMDTDESTPPDGPFAIRQVLKQLKKFEDGFGRMEVHCKAAADNSFAASEAVRHLQVALQELKKEHGDRLVRLELDRLWIPRAVSTAALLVSLATAIFVLVTRTH